MNDTQNIEDVLDVIPDSIEEMDPIPMRDEILNLRETIESMELDADIRERDMEKYRQRLSRRDATIRKMHQCLKAIAQDNPCGAHHNSMAAEAIKGHRDPI